ncbi:MAG: ABC transporter substrate-binding protein [Armatimonadetes bacterium]|nr:ABC transporter substrate-binding protein [Armatimonadota bacterium]
MVSRRLEATLVIATLIIGLGTVTLSAAGKASSKKPYVIGAIFSTTGDNAPLGVPERNTVEMLAKQINRAGGIKGHPVKVEFYDDAGNPQAATQACQELLANKDVVAIIGPTLSGPSLAIAQMCQDAKMPLVSCAASIKIVQPVKSFVFKTAQSDSLAVAQILAYAKKHKIKTVGFINDSNAFGASGRDQWNKLADAARVNTVATESFGTSDTDMTAQLTKIRASNPQAVVCWGTNPGPSIVAKDMKRLGMKQAILMSHGIANMDFIKLAQSAADGVVFPAGKLIVAKSMPGSDRQKAVLLKYAKDYEASYKKGPNTFGGHAWDAFQLVVNAVRKVGPDRNKIRAALEGTKNFTGISGIFNFSPSDHNGLTKDSFAMVGIKGGKWTLIR